MREATTIAYTTADAIFDWPESNPEAGRRHGFATEGLQRGDLLESSFAPRLYRLYSDADSAVHLANLVGKRRCTPGFKIYASVD